MADTLIAPNSQKELAKKDTSLADHHQVNLNIIIIIIINT